MSSSEPVAVRHLGQSGFRFEARSFVIYIDPYLSDSVEEREGAALARLIPAPILPEDVRDADLVCISHAHLDHCDDATLRPLSIASPKCLFLCPAEVADRLRSIIPDISDRIVVAREQWMEFENGPRIRTVPAAHPRVERDKDGHLRCVGFILDFGDRRIYHSGDTSVDPEVTATVHSLGPIHAALLPVNECNYFRHQMGIVGNMSVREAFGFARQLGVRILVPMHYDMFAPNSVYVAEIAAIYEGERPPFRLELNPLRL